MISPLEIKPLPGYRLWCRFSDGTEGEADLHGLAGRGVFRVWERPGAFESVTLGPGRGVSWGDEVELCADSLYLMITGKRPEELFETLGSTTAAVDA